MLEQEDEIQFCLEEVESIDHTIGIQLCFVWYKDTETTQFFVSYTGNYDQVIYFETLDKAYRLYTFHKKEIESGKKCLTKYEF